MPPYTALKDLLAWLPLGALSLFSISGWTEPYGPPAGPALALINLAAVIGWGLILGPGPKVRQRSAIWATATFLSHFLLGWGLVGVPIQRLLGSYQLFEGQLWALMPVAAFFIPYLAARVWRRPQYVLLVGPRFSGKTVLAQQVAGAGEAWFLDTAPILAKMAHLQGMEQAQAVTEAVMVAARQAGKKYGRVVLEIPDSNPAAAMLRDALSIDGELMLVKVWASWTTRLSHMISRGAVSGESGAKEPPELDLPWAWDREVDTDKLEPVAAAKVIQQMWRG